MPVGGGTRADVYVLIAIDCLSNELLVAICPMMTIRMAPLSDFSNCVTLPLFRSPIGLVSKLRLMRNGVQSARCDAGNGVW